MDKNVLIQLTNKLYQITLLFPKKEPLRRKMREVADEILAENSSLPKSAENCSLHLETLDSFFEVAKKQTWVSPQEILNLQTEYSKVRREIALQPAPVSEETGAGQEKVIELPQAAQEVVGISPDKSINGRQKLILDFLKENGRAQVGDLVQILPEVTKRTLRRDFRNLLKQGLIERIGERNETYYRLKG